MTLFTAARNLFLILAAFAFSPAAVAQTCSGVPKFETLSFSIDGAPVPISPAFDPDVCAYTLTVPEGVVTVIPTFTVSGGLGYFNLGTFIPNSFSGTTFFFIISTTTELVFNVVAGGSAAQQAAGRRYTFTISRGQSQATDYTPTSVTATAADESVALAWNPPADTAAADATYTLRWAAPPASLVYLNTGGTAGMGISGGSGARSFRVTGLTNGVSYNFQLGGMNPAGETFWAAIVMATPVGAPGAPRLMTDPGDTEIRLAWTPGNGGGAPIDEYRYRWSNDNDDSDWENSGGGGGIAIADSAAGEANAAAWTLAGVTNSATYHVQIAAVNTHGLGDWSASSEAVPGVYTPRALPRVFAGSIVVSGLREGLQVNWNPFAEPLAEPILTADGYRMRWRLKSPLENWRPGEDGVAHAGGELSEAACGVINLRAGCRETTIGGGSGDITPDFISHVGVYQVQIAAVNKNGIGAWSAVQEVAATSNSSDETLSAAPEDLSAAGGDGALMLTWTAPAGRITDYRARWKDTTENAWQGWVADADALRIGDSADGVNLASTAANYTVTDLTVGATYAAQVAGVNEAGRGAWSGSLVEVLAGEPGTPGRLGAPAVLTGAAGNATIFWNRSTETLVQTNPYRLRWRVKNPQGDWLPDDNGFATVAVRAIVCAEAGLDADCLGGFQFDGKLIPGETYQVQVAAVNDVGTGAWSPSGEGATGGTLGAATAPTLTMLIPAMSALNLSWTSPVHSGNGISGYRVRWAKPSASTTFLNPGGENGDDIPDSAPGETNAATYLLAGLTHGIALRVQIAAVTSAGTGVWSVVKTATPFGTPLAPSFHISTATDGGFIINWTPPTNTGGKAIQNYRYRWSNDGDNSDWESSGGAGGVVISGGGSVRMLELTGLVNGINYEVQVAAENSVGLGEWSTSQRAEPIGPPETPQTVAVAARDMSLIIGWQPPANGGGVSASALSYQVRWRLQSATSFEAADIGETAAGVTMFTITSLTNAAEYSVQVRARNVIGDGEWSAAVNGVPAAFDLDLDGIDGADWKDGVLVARHLFGLHGDAFANNIIADAAQAAAIELILAAEAELNTFDVDADGEITAADGVLIARYLLGVESGAGLTTGYAADTAAAAIAMKIMALLP